MSRSQAGSALPAGRSYDDLRHAFRWRLPSTLNLGVETSERQPRQSPAILVTDRRDVTRIVTFGALSDDSNRLANALQGLGVATGDRVGDRPPAASRDGGRPRRDTKLRAIAVPLSVLFGPEALDARLGDADVRVVLGERVPLERVAALGLDVPHRLGGATGLDGAFRTRATTSA